MIINFYLYMYNCYYYCYCTCTIICFFLSNNTLQLPCRSSWLMRLYFVQQKSIIQFVQQENASILYVLLLLAIETGFPMAGDVWGCAEKMILVGLWRILSLGSGQSQNRSPEFFTRHHAKMNPISMVRCGSTQKNRFLLDCDVFNTPVRLYRVYIYTFHYSNF